MPSFENFMNLTKKLSQVEAELGIENLSSLDKRILYCLGKKESQDTELSFEDLNRLMDTPRASLYRRVVKLVDEGFILKIKDISDGRRRILRVAL